MILNMNGGGNSDDINVNGSNNTCVVGSGYSVSAGDFVSFQFGTWGTSNSVLTAENSMGTYSATYLSDGRFIVIGSSSNEDKICVTFGTPSGNEITWSSRVDLSDSKHNYNGSGVIEVAPNKILVFYYASKMQFALYSVSGNTLTKLSSLDTDLWDIYESPQFIKLSDNKFLFNVPRGESNNTHTYIVTISNNTISLSSAYEIGGSYSSYGDCIMLDDSTLLSTYRGASYSLYGSVYTINGNTLTLKYSGKISDATSANSEIFDAHLVLISKNKVFIAFSSGYYGDLTGIIIDVGETAFSVLKKETNLMNSGFYGGGDVSVLKIGDNVLSVTYTANSDYEFNHAMLFIDDKYNFTYTNSSHGVTGDNSGSYCKQFLLSGNTIVIFHGYSDYVRCVLKTSDAVIPYNGETIYGVAKDSGVAGDVIDVYIPAT